MKRSLGRASAAELKPEWEMELEGVMREATEKTASEANKGELALSASLGAVVTPDLNPGTESELREMTREQPEKESALARDDELELEM
jgi:hypothetical protein